MNFFGKGKKGSKKRLPPGMQEPAIDFSSPDAFSEENMAKMSGVDTIAFDENDPALMAELAELGWGGDDSTGGGNADASTTIGHRPPSDAAPVVDKGRRASGAPSHQQSGNDLLRSLGLSLNSIGDPEITEEDLHDPDLLEELGEISGGAGLDVVSTNSAGGNTGSGYRGYVDEDDGVNDDVDDDDAVEPDRESDFEREDEDLPSYGDLQEEKPFIKPAKPSLSRRGPSSIAASPYLSGSNGGGAAGDIARLEHEVKALNHRAIELHKAGDKAGACQALRAAKSAGHELAVLRTLETTRKVATVKTEYIAPSSAEDAVDDEEEEEEEEEEDASTPSPAGAGEGGGKPVSAELVVKQVKLLKQRAIELKKEGRKAEALACLKRSMSLEADMLRDAHGKGLVGASDVAEGDGRRPSFARQGSASMSRRPSVANPPPPVARKGSGSGSMSRSGLPPSGKVPNKPKAFPAERDLFSDLEDALAAAIQLHMDRAKSLVKKDRAAAAKEVKRYKGLQAKLDLTRDMRAVPGARPPPWQWKITKKNRIRVLEQVAIDQVELEIYRVQGLTEKTDNRGSIWIKYDLGYSKDEKTGKGLTHSCRADADTVDVNFKASSYLKRAKSTQMAFQNRRASLEIFHKKNLVSGGKLIGKCLVPLQPLLSTCELTLSSPILTEGRREAGGSVEMSLSLRKPISSDEVIVTEEKELEVGEWPPVSLDPVVQTPAVAPVVVGAAAPAPAPVAQTPASGGLSGGGGRAGGAASAAARVEAAAQFEKVVLTDKEKSNPFGVENLDSNEVLEAEIQAVAAKAAAGDLDSIMRKGALETKLLMLESAVQSGELDISGYCDILKERVIRDKVLALYLKNEKRTKEALAVMKRIRAMEQELASVPQAEEGEEEA